MPIFAFQFSFLSVDIFLGNRQDAAREFLHAVHSLFGFHLLGLGLFRHFLFPRRGFPSARFSDQCLVGETTTEDRSDNSHESIRVGSLSAIEPEGLLV